MKTVIYYDPHDADQAKTIKELREHYPNAVVVPNTYAIQSQEENTDRVMAISYAIDYIKAKGSTPTEDLIEVASRIHEFLTNSKD